MKCFWNQTVVRVLSVLTLGVTLFAPATVHARGFGGGGGGHSFGGAARSMAGNGGGHFAQHLQNGARNLGQPSAARNFVNNHANGGSSIGQAVRQNSSLQNKFQGNRTGGGLVKNLSQNNGMKSGVANNFSKSNTFASNFAKNNSFAKSNKGIVNNVAKNDGGKRGNGLHQNGPRNLQQGTLKNLAGGPNGLRDGKGRDGKGRDHDGRGRDGKGRDGKGRDGKGRDGQGRDGKGRGRGRDNDMIWPQDGRWMGLGLGILDAVQGLGGGGGGGDDGGGGGGGDCGGGSCGDLDNFADNSMPMDAPMQMVDQQPMDMNQEVAQAPPQEEGPPPVDLELVGVELLEPGDMAAAKGPLYRVAVMNKSDVPVPGFDVALVATNGDEPGQKSPFAHKRVEYIAPGDVGVVDVRLPAKANQLVSEAEPFTTLFVGVDSRGEIQETDKDNNIAKVQRTDIPNASERLASAQ